MGRKRKSGLDVCPFDVNMLSDIRMRRLIRLHQGDAIAVYMAALCLIYRDGYYVEFNEDVCFYLSEQTGVSEDAVNRIIEDAVACALFDKDIFTSDGVLTSQEIQDSYIEERSRIAKRQASLEKFVISSEVTPQNSEIEPQNRDNAEELPQNRDNAEELPQNRDNAEELPQNAAKCGVNVCNNPVNVDINPSETVLPESEGQSEEVARKVNITAIDVVDSDNTSLELFNISSNNYINQEKEKIRKKEKEAGLALPYCSAEFVGTWEKLCKQPKWKKKTKDALQMSLNKLGKYPEEFAILLMENAIAGGWQGVVFTWTPDEFRKWQARQSGVPLPAGNKKPKDIYESNIESMNEAFRLIDEKYGT